MNTYIIKCPSAIHTITETNLTKSIITDDMKKLLSLLNYKCKNGLWYRESYIDEIPPELLPTAELMHSYGLVDTRFGYVTKTCKFRGNKIYTHDYEFHPEPNKTGKRKSMGGSCK